MAATPMFALLDGLALGLQSGPLSTAKVALFTNSPVLRKVRHTPIWWCQHSRVIADPSATFTELSEDGEGNIVLQSGLLFFQPTNNTNLPQTIYGYALYNHAVSGFPLLLAEYLPAPVVLSSR